MSTLVRFFQDGGAFMYPILFVFAFGVAIADRALDVSDDVGRERTVPFGRRSFRI